MDGAAAKDAKDAEGSGGEDDEEDDADSGGEDDAEDDAENGGGEDDAKDDAEEDAENAGGEDDAKDDAENDADNGGGEDDAEDNAEDEADNGGGEDDAKDDAEDELEEEGEEEEPLEHDDLAEHDWPPTAPASHVWDVMDSQTMAELATGENKFVANIAASCIDKGGQVCGKHRQGVIALQSQDRQEMVSDDMETTTGLDVPPTQDCQEMVSDAVVPIIFLNAHLSQEQMLSDAAVINAHTSQDLHAHLSQDFQQMVGDAAISIRFLDDVQQSQDCQEMVGDSVLPWNDLNVQQSRGSQEMVSDAVVDPAIDDPVLDGGRVEVVNIDDETTTMMPNESDSRVKMLQEQIARAKEAL